jgi:flagellar motor switch protein FliN/FliY
MSFSASPLVPGAPSGDDSAAWQQSAERVAAAVSEALAQIPSAEPLTLGTPTAEAVPSTLPDPAGAAVTGYLSSGAEGKILLVVGQDLVEALEGTPFGAVEPAQALRPALETVADRLGGRLDGDPTGIGVEDCLDVLAGGTVVLIPLLAAGALRALVAVSLAATPAGSPSATTAAGAARSWGIDMLRDVEMEVTCELGRTRMTVKQLLALAPGDVVELDRLAGSPADLLVNGTLLARGEVVVVDESFGVRITEIVTRDAT